MISQDAQEIRKEIQKDKLREDVPLAARRREWDVYSAGLPLAEGPFSASCSDTVIPTLLLTSPITEDDSLILHFHGGGLTEGSIITHREFASRLVQKTEVPVMLFDYPLAPENPYPAALNQTISLYQELLDSGYEANRIFFSGDSSGCNLQLSTLVRLRDMQTPLPAGVLMLSAHLDCTQSGESMQSRSDVDPSTSEEVLADCVRLYTGSIDPASPDISPLFADLTGLPPFLIQVGNDEILLSDSKRLAERLNTFGGSPTLQVWNHMWHVWPMYGDFPEAKEALDAMAQFVHRVRNTSI